MAIGACSRCRRTFILPVWPSEGRCPECRGEMQSVTAREASRQMQEGPCRGSPALPARLEDPWFGAEQVREDLADLRQRSQLLRERARQLVRQTRTARELMRRARDTLQEECLFLARYGKE